MRDLESVAALGLTEPSTSDAMGVSFCQMAETSLWDLDTCLYNFGIATSLGNSCVTFMTDVISHWGKPDIFLSCIANDLAEAIGKGDYALGICLPSEHRLLSSLALIKRYWMSRRHCLWLWEACAYICMCWVMAPVNHCASVRRGSRYQDLPI